MADARIDLNADLGEGIGDDAAMLGLVTSANIACGGHASDPDLMFATLRLAADRGVAIGAHPGYAGPREFRPHGDSNGAASDRPHGGGPDRRAAGRGGAGRGAGPLRQGAWRTWPILPPMTAPWPMPSLRSPVPRGLALLAISGTELQAAGQAAGIPTDAEIFADRAYLATGRLVPRSHPQAMIHDANEALTRLISVLRPGLMPVLDGAPIRLAAQSICIHGDSPGAVAMARTICATG